MSAIVNGQGTSQRKAGAKVTVVLGAQWGDEGKGKLVDILSTNADLVCRCQVCTVAQSVVVTEILETKFFNIVYCSSETNFTTRPGSLISFQFL